MSIVCQTATIPTETLKFSLSGKPSIAWLCTCICACIRTCVCVLYRDPGQLLSTSNTLMLKVVTLQVGEDGSGSDEATSINSEGEGGPK